MVDPVELRKLAGRKRDMADALVAEAADMEAMAARREGQLLTEAVKLEHEAHQLLDSNPDKAAKLIHEAQALRHRVHPE